jgi:hypothetical protein
MALNRAWYDALVDDDGSNSIGTVWGKDDIKNLLDSVDAEILRMDAQRTPFNCQITTAEWATCHQAGTTVDAGYAKVGNLVFWYANAENLLIPASTAYLHVATPPGTTTNYQQVPSVRLGIPGSGPRWGYGRNDPGGWVNVFNPSAPWPSGVGDLFLQAFYFNL